MCSENKDANQMFSYNSADLQLGDLKNNASFF